MKITSLTDSDLDLTRAASTFAALGSEQRLAVLRVLVRAGPDGLAIGELGARSCVTGSTLTHHMRILAAAGLVSQVREGRKIICIAAAYGEMEALSDFLLNECCADADSPHEGHDHG
ncbi:MAG: helix-turn-helix domain-containing protein [Silicimonas sp.]|nr:helix-turn-helix domain-containing protein [Silicimonas sp.]